MEPEDPDKVMRPTPRAQPVAFSRHIRLSRQSMDDVRDALHVGEFPFMIVITRRAWIACIGARIRRTFSQ
jgi:hypothetical protein